MALRILFLSHEYPPQPSGGIGFYTQAMARSLADIGHDVHVMSCVLKQVSSDSTEDGVTVHRRPLLGRRLPRAQRGDSLVARVTTSMSCLANARDLGDDFDVIESPDHMAEGLLLASRSSTPVVVCLHHGQRWARGWRSRDLLERRMIARARLIRSPSKLLLERLTAMKWLDGDRTRVLPVPFFTRGWDPAPPPPRPTILVPGRLESLKAPEVALRAAALARRHVPDLEVLFVGRSVEWHHYISYQTRLEGLAQSLEVPCRVTGPVARSDMPDWYARSSLVVLPSVADSFPTVALEALACTRPVVCTTGSGAAELIEPSDAGAVVSPWDAVAMAEAMTHYLGDETAAVRAGQNGRKHVERVADPIAAARAAEDFYREAIDRGKP